MKPAVMALIGALFCSGIANVQGADKVKFAIIGLTHDHAAGFIPGAKGHSAVDLVGIVEPNLELANSYARRYQLPAHLFATDLQDLLSRTNVQAVGIFTSTFEHRKVVEECARYKIHAMMEKPLAVSMEHARAMATAAKRGGIQLIVNYETTWYPGNHMAYDLVFKDRAIGDLRKLVIHDGHSGPKEIGCSQPFLDWLTDPVLNGGGALTDFGCYGANLTTWLMNGQRPESVFAVTQQIKPHVYPNVDDEATIVLTYPKAQTIIQASWNWPFNRKDMEVYGVTGYVLVPNHDTVRLRKSNERETELKPPALTGPHADPLSYLAAVVRGELRPQGLSSLENNLVVTEILDAARKSARTGKRVDLP